MQYYINMDFFNRLGRLLIFLSIFICHNIYAKTIILAENDVLSTAKEEIETSKDNGPLILSNNLSFSYDKDIMLKLINEKTTIPEYKLKTFSLFNLKAANKEKINIKKEDSKTIRSFIRVDFIVSNFNKHSQKQIPTAVRTNIQKYVVGDTFWGEKYQILDIFANGIRVEVKNIDEKFINNLLQDKKNRRNIKLMNDSKENSVAFNLFTREKFDLDTGEFFY